MDVLNGAAKSLPLWSVAWEVDNASGSTFVRATGDDHARAIFRSRFPAAFRIVSVQRGY